MKTLQASSVYNMIGNMKSDTSTQMTQLASYHQALVQFITDEETMKGSAGDAIRAYFQDVHLTFVTHLGDTLQSLSHGLDKLESAIKDLDSDENASIREEFLEGTLIPKLKDLKESVTTATDGINDVFSEYSDVISLGRLSDSDVLHGLRQAEDAAETMIEDLYQMDQEGMTTMQPIEERIALLSSFLQEITSKTIDGSLSPVGYSRSQIENVDEWKTISSQNAAVRNAHMAKLQETKMYAHTLPTEYLYKGMYEHAQIDPEVSPWYYMEHLPVSAEVNTGAAINACGPPTDTAGVNTEQGETGGALDATLNFFKGAGKGIWNAGKDTYEGIKNIVTDPVGVYNDTRDFIVAVADDPAILVDMGKELWYTFEEDVINGDAESRGQWFGYAGTIVATSVVGDKGISKIGSAGRLGKVGGDPGKTTQHNLGVQLSTQNPVSKPSLTSTMKQTGLNGVNALNDFTQKAVTSTAKFANQTAQNVQRITNKAIDKSVQAMSHFTGGGGPALATVTNAGRTVTPPPPHNVLNPVKIQSDLKAVTEANLRKVEAKAGLQTAVHTTRMDQISVDFKQNSKHDTPEFNRQLKDQETGMNKLTMDEYLKNRQRYLEEGRAIEGNAAQRAAREWELKNKIDELYESGLTKKQAEQKANEWIKTQAALHNPDQIAGGVPSHISGLGDSSINSSLGSQWKYRIDIVDEKISNIAKNMNETQLKNTSLNVKLTRK
ncbi:polymorphic toxin type 15 domain-containing protein [Alkalicoccobacillus murimartini]|uniref:Ribonuclease toxin of YeeF-YezG toxin-antitoxin module n=1 Tax=Alkalicoccobacillus murimartini TaxID=171685 RepID=A0ABT9YIX4_9BACI|nr:T7SS effector LXG polymorphic toxin [Alkalicoccobacillus murimartini]MDQ0206984.1 putative ribonuclease toxin of YeeF-YezG toxin-antitoxin module [Alkalicoccobacillus murimartini]